MVYCDICQLPMMGLAFRCGSDQCSPKTEGGVLFDLCFNHYNGGRHFLDHPFRCFLPSDDIKNDGLVLPVFLSMYGDMHVYTIDILGFVSLRGPPHSATSYLAYIPMHLWLDCLKQPNWKVRLQLIMVSPVITV